jgi:hypothetical protein
MEAWEMMTSPGAAATLLCGVIANVMMSNAIRVNLLIAPASQFLL